MLWLRSMVRQASSAAQGYASYGTVAQHISLEPVVNTSIYGKSICFKKLETYMFSIFG